jgi:hypothetical protein
VARALADLEAHLGLYWPRLEALQSFGLDGELHLLVLA